VAGHDPKHDTTRTPEAKVVPPGHPGDPANLGHGQPPLYATSVPEYSETGVFYEKEDTNPRSIAKVGIILAVTAIVSALFTLGFFKVLAHQDEQAEADMPPLWAHTNGERPPEPRLQATVRDADGTLATPAGDLAAVRSEERTTLSSYGWVDKPAGIVRIPIDDAMRLYAERGAAAPPPASASPASAPTPAPAVGAAPAAPAPVSGGHR
jgi:hypothetical protein